MSILGNRLILITGAASGIGLATARLFAKQGAKLVLLDRDEAALAAAADETGGVSVAVDLFDRNAAVAAVETAALRLGGLDGLVNCAGIAGSMPLDELDPDSWDRFIGINLTAPYLVCRTALPFLRKRPGSTIVNIASGQALLPNAPGIAAYAASKAGLVAFTKALGAELAPAIRANTIAPGIVATPLVANVLGEGDPDAAPFVQQYAMRRVARPEEIADAILFLSSPASSYITGTVLAVDGGRTYH